MKLNIKLGLLLGVVLMVSSCNDNYLNKLPETAINKENFFRTQNDLEMYVLNLYNFSASEIYEADATTDNASTTGVKEIKTMMLGSPSSTTITTGWSWGRLRDINFYLENMRNANLSEEVLNHYEGLGRYFRARFYVDKVQRYSDVPWIDKVVTTADEATLMGKRDTRDFVVQKIMEDFEFAAQHVNASSESGAVNKWVVLQEFSRFALYEGTFRRYHNELSLEASANTFLTKAQQAAERVMNEGGFQIHNTGKPNEDYASLFFNQNLEGNKEVIMARYYTNNILNGSSWPGMFGNYEYYPLRDMVQSYLMKDGTFYSAQAGYQTYSFVKEFENRDPRLSQTYAYPGWQLSYTSTYSQGDPLYVQQLAKNFSGYHQIKGFLNTLNLEVRNNIDIPIYRYAEVLLNYAEAKAELGTITQSDLDKSVNLLRKRAGMPDMTMNVGLDPVMAERYPQVQGTQKNLVLEVRRERRVELAFEGYRFNDLMRWKSGKLLERKPEGIYFSGLGKHDMTGDGIPDLILLPASESIPEVRETNSLGAVLRYYRAGTFGQDVSVFLNEGNKGTVGIVENTGTFIDPKYYYRPVPQNQMLLNPNLTQIFGWE